MTTNRAERLSDGQARLKVLMDAAPDAPHYHVTRATRHTGALSVHRESQAIWEILRRHWVLRSRFVGDGAEARQIVSPSTTCSVPVVDISGVPEDRREELLRQLVVSANLRPIHLDEAPVARFGIIVLKDGEFVLHRAVHHIAFDGPSDAIVARETRALREHFSRGEPSTLPELASQYVDYSAESREDESRSRASLAYWRKQALGDACGLLADRPRPIVPSLRAEYLAIRVGPLVKAQLEKFVKASGSTPFVVLLAACEVALWRFTQNRNIVVGFPSSDRRSPATKAMVGFFVNSLPIATDIVGTQSFAEVVGTVRRSVFGALEHQDVSFARLVRELAPSRDASHNPLFQIMFTIAARSAETRSAARAAVAQERTEPDEPLPIDTNAETLTARFDLEFMIRDAEDGISLGVTYNTDIHEAATIRSFLSTYARILEQGIASPDVPIGRLVASTKGAEGEDPLAKTEVCAKLPASAGSGEERKTLVDLFHAAARGRPDAAAVVFGDEVVTYLQLQQRANRVSAELRRLGVGPGSVVAIHSERDPGLVVAILAVLQVGAAYLPIDPTYPEERKEFSLTDSRATVVLASAGWRPPGAMADQLCVVPLAELAREAPTEESFAYDASVVIPESPAYVIYTSGSTGRPKGVLVPHRAVTRLVSSVADYFQFTENDVWSLSHSASFDVSVFELWGAFAFGACVVLVPSIVSRTPEMFYELLQATRTTVLSLTPSALDLLLAAGAILEDLGSVKHIILAGETMSLEAVAPLVALADKRGAKVTNMYGTTETCVHATIRHVVPADCRRYAASPVGLPIPDLTMTLLQRGDLPTPPGAPGEIVLSGPGVAHGYLNRPALSADRFRPSEAGGLCYRTGDWGRWHPAGEFEFLGRRDHQVKIRGFRIELGEVSFHLTAQPQVKEATCLVRDHGGNASLVAYIVPIASELEAATKRWTQASGESFDALFEQAAGGTHDDAIGYEDSYKAEPMEASSMREYVDGTVSRIRALRPSSVLEIGCGNGLLLRRLAPSCGTYVGVDVSSNILERLAKDVKDLGGGVRLVAAEASAVAGLLTQTFDTVVLNSVSQCFPHLDYLFEALNGAVRLTAPGGKIFVGDVRDLRLQRAKHASVAFHRSPPTTTFEELKREALRLVSGDTDLWLSPEVFYRFCERLDRPCRAEILLKRGRRQNEIVAFRYDVVLHLDEPPVSEDGTLGNLPEHAWRAGLTGELAQLLRSHPSGLTLVRVPNRRTDRALHVAAAVESARVGSSLVGELRTELTRDAVDPEELCAIGEQEGFDVRLTPSADLAEPGFFDAHFTRNGERWAPSRVDRERPSGKGALASFPVAGLLSLQIWPAVRAAMADQLPTFMVPTSAVFLPQLPRLPNGKLDRASLSALEPVTLPGKARSEELTPLEARLADLIVPLLGLDLGADDNFFEKGVDSIHVVRIVSQCREKGISIEALDPFRHPSIRELAHAIERRAANASVVEVLEESTDLPSIEEVCSAKGLRPGDVEAVHPVTPFQAWMLERQLREPESELHWGICTGAFPIDPAYDLERHAAALEAVEKHHHWLRMSFAWDGLQRPVQVVHRRSAVRFDEVDLRRLSEPDQQQALEDVIHGEQRTPFPLDAPMQRRFKVVLLSDSRRMLIESQHYTRIDGWSNQFISAELGAAYRAPDRFEPAERPPYARYSEWLKRQPLRPLQAYFTDTFVGRPPDHRLADLAMRSAPPRVFAREFSELSESLQLGVLACARAAKVTPAVVLESAWLLVCGAHGSSDVAAGISLAGRPLDVPGIDRVSGCFVNILPVRVDLGAVSTLRELLDAVQAQKSSLMSFSHTPPAELNKWCGASALDILYESYVYVRNYPAFNVTGFERPKEGPLNMPWTQTGMPLRIEVGRLLTGNSVTFHYYTRFFTRERIQLLLRQYLAAIGLLSRGPSTPLAELREALTTAAPTN